MKFKGFLSLFLVGCMILIGFVFFILKIIQQEDNRKQLIDEFWSRNDVPPPLIPRTEEIPDDIRQKFATVKEKPVLIAEFSHEGYSKTVEFSPTNTNLVVSRTFQKNSEKEIKLWDINNPNTPLAEFSGDSVSFSPDGKILAISDLGQIEGGVRLWNIAEEQFIGSLRVAGFESVFSPDNIHIATKTSGIELWNVSNPNQPEEAINLETKNFQNDHTFSVDGKLMATVESRTDEVNIWEINGNQVIKKNSIKVIDEKNGWIEAMEFLPDPKNPILAISDNDEDFRMYYPPDWQNYSTVPAGYVKDLAFTPDGKTIVSGGINGIKFWSVDSGERIASIRGHSSWIKCVNVSADGRFVAGFGNDGVIRIWDIENYLPTKQETIQNTVVPIYFLPTNRMPQVDILEKIDKILGDLQTYFADEMERHGYGRKSFKYEKNNKGYAKVFLFEGKTSDDYYFNNTSSRVKNEINDYFDLNNNLYFIIIDESIEKKGKKYSASEHESIEKKAKKYSTTDLEIIQEYIRDMVLETSNFIFRELGGNIVVQTPLTKYSMYKLAAKFGDSMGLNRDFRSPSYLMSYSDQTKHISKSSAAWLDKSRFFNSEKTFFNDKTKIQKLRPTREKARFEVEDDDGLYQVRLLVTPTNENPPPSFQWKSDPTENQSAWKKKFKGKSEVLYDYVTFNGQKKATVELDYPKYVDNFIKLYVIDGKGNRVYMYMQLVDRIDISRVFRRLFN